MPLPLCDCFRWLTAARVLVWTLGLAGSADLGAAATPPTDTAWMAQAQAQLAAREYAIADSDHGWQAPNRAQGFRVRFSADAIRVVTRADGVALGTLRLASLGRSEALMDPGPARFAADPTAVTLRWPLLDARLTNSPAGLATAWTLTTPPAGQGQSVLRFAIEDARPRLRAGAVALTGAAGGLTLQDFTATDAVGRKLAVATTLGAGQVQLTLDDTDAHYPITLRSLITGAADAILQSNQAEASFGVSVAAAGDVNGDGYADVIVGAPSYDVGQANEGAAFLYYGAAGAFNASADAQLVANQANAEFGHSVAGGGDIDGDGYADVIVGAPRFDRGEADEGAALVYLGGSGAFDTASDGVLEFDQAGAHVGTSVAGAGDVNGDGYADLVVGADSFSNGQSLEGVALIYFGGAGGVDANADAILQPNQAGARTGTAVAGAGDVNGDGYADVLVGAPGYDSGQTDEGAALLYFGGVGAFDSAPDALLQSNQVAAAFGAAVAGAGDVNGDGYADVVVGAPNFDSNAVDAGVALLYFGGAAVFNLQADAQLSSDQPGAHLGAAVAGAGDVNGDGYGDVLTGAPDDSDGQSGEGLARVYFGGAGAFNSGADARLASDQIGAAFGASVAGVGDVNGDGYADLIIGAPFYDDGQSNEGGALVFFGTTGAFDTTPDIALLSDQSDAVLGTSVAGAGDVNGDGYGDLIVGAPAYDLGQTNSGAAFLYFGNVNGVSATASAQLTATQAFAYFGFSVASAGDVNGDGFADVIVGAPGFDDGQTDRGAAFIYFGSSGNFNGIADATLGVAQANASFGNAVAAAGDVNGDGYGDVIVGAPFFDNGEIDEGAAFIYFGSTGVLDSNADALLQLDLAGANVGYSVACAGDTNGDGYADVVVGAPGTGGGGAYIYWGGPGSFGIDWHQAVNSLQAGASLGFSVATAGDVNGDGRGDVIVGAPYYDGSQTDSGAAVVLYGNSFGSPQLDSPQGGAYFGQSVAGAGDVNGDGYGDVIVGAPYQDNGQVDEGVASVYFGGSGVTVDPTPDVLLESNQAGANAGSSVAAAGDINGDGRIDLVIGAPGFDGAVTDGGTALLYLSSGRPLLANQYRGDGVLPVARWGLSRKSDGFVVALQGTSPRGRERAKLMLEACRGNVPFGSVFCSLYVAPNWDDLGTQGFGRTLTLSTTGMGIDDVYRWRARVLYAPLTVGAPGISAPPRPAAGPWWRLQANSEVADIRISASDRLYADGFE